MIATEDSMAHHEHTGYRYDDRNLAVGDDIPDSHVWDGDERTDDELDGVCCFETLEQAREYGRWSKGIIVKVGGSHMSYGDDLEGEIIIRDAVVVEIMNTNATEDSMDISEIKSWGRTMSIDEIKAAAMIGWM